MNTNFKKVLALFSFLSLFISIQISAQTKKWDSTYRPSKYKEIVAKWDSEKITKKDYVFLGNSITAGTDWSKLLALPNAVNRGISGDITYGVLERLDQIINGKPKKIFILIGINDVSRNIPDSLIVNNYKKMIERIRKGSKKTEIYFNTLLPVNAVFDKFKNHYGKDNHILYLNSEIKKLAAKKVTIIDLYPVFLDKENKLKAELTKDGLHLIPEGYQVWSKFLKQTGYLK